ncbi:hypothetical protein QZH41_010846 [Actinostola sp. cb2023]|nr:hypothetical protein QZH41_010846 [Actinostola sp. cb2023]
MVKCRGSNVTNSTSNDTSGSAPSPLVLPQDLKVGVTLFAIIIFFTALIGNTIVVYIVCSCNHMRNTTNILIANMAIADLWITLDIPYVLKWIFVGELWFGGGFGQFLCKFLHSAQAGSIACSIFTLVCVSFDRSLAILFPMRTILTMKIVQVLIVIIWLLTLALSTPIFMASIVYQKPDGLYRCNEDGWADISILSQPKYITAYTLCTYLVPLSFITTMYIMTGFRLWSRKIPGHSSLRVHKRVQSSNKRATIMLVTVVIVFALCWFPLQISELLKVHVPHLIHKIPIRLFVLLPWFGFANSAINPILYVIFSENYRREFKRTFTRKSRRRSSTSMVSRGMTMRTRMSLSTSVPLQKLRNDSFIPNDIAKEESSDSARKNREDSPTRQRVASETPDSDSLLASIDQGERRIEEDSGSN